MNDRVIKLARPGAIVSSDSDNPARLFEAMMGVMKSLDETKHMYFSDMHEIFLAKDEPGDDGLWIIVDELWGSLQEHAPEGHVFGRNPYDSAEVGFWPDLPDLSVSSEMPAHAGPYVVLSTHPNDPSWYAEMTFNDKQDALDQIGQLHHEMRKNGLWQEARLVPPGRSSGNVAAFWDPSADTPLRPYMTMAEAVCAIHDMNPWDNAGDCMTKDDDAWHVVLVEAGARVSQNEASPRGPVSVDPDGNNDPRWANRTRYEFHDGSAIIDGGGVWSIGVHRSQASEAGRILTINGRGYTGRPEIDDNLVPPADPRDFGLYAHVRDHHQFIHGMQLPDARRILQWKEQHVELLADLRQLEKKEPAAQSTHHEQWTKDFSLLKASLDGHRELGVQEGFHSVSQELFGTVWGLAPPVKDSKQGAAALIVPLGHSGRFGIEWTRGAPDGAVLVSHHGQPWSSAKTEPAARTVAAHIAACYDAEPRDLPAKTLPELLSMCEAPVAASREKPRSRSGGFSF